MTTHELPPFFNFHMLYALRSPRTLPQLGKHLGWHPVQFERTLSDVLDAGLVHLVDEPAGALQLDAGAVASTLAGLDVAGYFAEGTWPDSRDGLFPGEAARLGPVLAAFGAGGGRVTDGFTLADGPALALLERHQYARRDGDAWVLELDAALDMLEELWPDAPKLYEVRWACEDCK